MNTLHTLICEVVFLSSVKDKLIQYAFQIASQLGQQLFTLLKIFRFALCIESSLVLWIIAVVLYNFPSCLSIYVHHCLPWIILIPSTS